MEKLHWDPMVKYPGSCRPRISLRIQETRVKTGLIKNVAHLIKKKKPTL